MRVPAVMLFVLGCGGPTPRDAHTGQAQQQTDSLTCVAAAAAGQVAVDKSYPGLNVAASVQATSSGPHVPTYWLILSTTIYTLAASVPMHPPRCAMHQSCA